MWVDSMTPPPPPLDFPPQDMLYSSSSNKIHVWKCSEDFPLVNEFESQYGALYSLATTRKYIITGIRIIQP